MNYYFHENITLKANPKDIFSFADDHKKFSSHMSTSSWMMGGGKMITKFDEGHGQKLGSHIIMEGKAFGFNLFLDEVISEYEPPKRKVWKTVGNINLLIIGHYQLGFYIEPENENSVFTVFIEYSLPEKHKWLGKLFGSLYAKWCVKQMIKTVKENFS